MVSYSASSPRMPLSIKSSPSQSPNSSLYPPAPNRCRCRIQMFLAMGRHMKPKKKAAKTKSKRSKMPKLFPIDDEMKELSAMLENEISDWPGVTKKPMFVFQGLYRDGVIFAALPRSRA